MSLMVQRGSAKVSREELREVPIPGATRTHQPLSHYQIVEALLESLSFRHLRVVKDEFAVSTNGMKMFGVLDLETEAKDFRFAIGIRNANDKSMRLAMTIGYRVLVCDNMAFQGDFSPVFHKHTKKLDLIDVVSIGVDKMQRGFEPLSRQITGWQRRELTDDQARLIIYQALVEGRLQAPRHLIADVHRFYFKPSYPEFRPRTLWSLSNAFTSALKCLRPIKQFQVTAKLGEFLATA
jgi:hypothetical protein